MGVAGWDGLLPDMASGFGKSTGLRIVFLFVKITLLSLVVLVIFLFITSLYSFLIDEICPVYIHFRILF